MTADTFQEVKESISLQAYAEAKLERKGKGYVCPSCKSGHGPKGTPAFSIKGDKWKCFSCGKGGDVFDLAGIIEGTDDRRRQLEAVAYWAGIDIEPQQTRTKVPSDLEARPKPKAPDYSSGREAERQRIAQAQKELETNEEAQAYLHERGFTLEEARRYGMGYCPDAPGAKTAEGTYTERGRLVIPYPGSDYYHIDRSIYPGADSGKYMKPKADAVGEEPIFNPAALDEDIFFLVEGQLDALAVMASGYQAIAIGTAAAERLAERMAARGTSGYCVIIADSDKAGERGAAQTAEALKRNAIPCMAQHLQGVKDAAELFARDRKALRKQLDSMRQAAETLKEDARERAYQTSLEAMSAKDPAELAAAIYEMRQSVEPVPTGLESVDKALDGGLYPGLYVLGAISSMGKTMLVTQMADQMAAAGQPVLFVTIEQSAEELVSLSLQRIAAAEPGGYRCKFHGRDLNNKARRNAWTEEQTLSLLQACNEYAEAVAPNLRIMEGEARPSVAQIAAAARIMQEQHGLAPVVIIDYLQLIAAENDRDTDKQATDKAVTALRQMARNLRTPVLAISSLNRGSYSGAVSMDSFKESGGIEYGADGLLGLQPSGMAERLAAVKQGQRDAEADKLISQAKHENPRKLELVILKHRSGALPDSPAQLELVTTCATYLSK